METFAAQDMAAVLNGSRRLGADLAFIQLLLYYGSMENARRGAPSPAPLPHEDPENHGKHGHVHMGEEAQADVENRRLGDFPHLKDYTLRVGDLDPYFHYAYLFGAGALGFNLNRVDQALDVLRDGAGGDPHFWRYRLYAGALAYRKAEDVQKVIPLLEEAIKDPECPSMLKNILANIHRREGNVKRAAEIFIELATSSRDNEYRDLALQKLREIQSGLSPRHR